MGDEHGRRKSDGAAFITYVSEEIGRLKEGYEIASKGYQVILVKMDDLDKKLEDLKDALYGNGPDHVGIFERIRALTVKVGVILFVLGAVGGFVGRFVERVIFK